MQVSRERIHGAATATYHHTKELVDASCSPDDCAAVCGRLAREIDDAFAAARRAGTPVACAPGCDFCCHLRVSVFEHEAAAVLHHLRTRLPQANAEAAERRIVANAARIDGMTVAQHYAGRMPCALLVDGSCSVYETRPSACAAHHSLSRARCEHAFAHPEHHGTPTNSRPASLELQTLGDALIAATQSALADNGRPATRRELHQSLRDLLERRDAADTPSTARGDSPCRAPST
jgi:Fe-S-cluster containining protein